jgi:hypothetical protein
MSAGSQFVAADWKFQLSKLLHISAKESVIFEASFSAEICPASCLNDNRIESFDFSTSAIAFNLQTGKKMAKIDRMS